MKICKLLNSFVVSVAIILIGITTATAQVSTPNIDFKKIIPPPPADNSPAGIADLETLIKVQEYRTEDQIKEAKRVDTHSAFGFARPVLGEWYQSGKFPKTKKMMDEIGNAANKICDKSKAHYNRQRPYQRDTRIKPVVGHPGNASYPSGHTFGATIWAVIYSEVFPEYAAEFDAQAHRTMWGRIMAGVHYPTDTTAAYMLAQAVGKEMLKDPQVKKYIKEIRKEIEENRPKDS